MLARRRRKAFKELYKLSHATRGCCEPVSLMRRDRVRYDSDGLGWREYGFLPPCIGLLSDDAIKEYIKAERVCYVTSPYDCSGQAFTCWFDFHRNPSGRVSFVHAMGIDL